MKARLTISVLLLAALVGVSGTARAEEVDYGSEILKGISSSSIVLPLLTTRHILSNGSDRREVIAQAALEDAAVYFESGRLTGILPSAIQDIKYALALRHGGAPESISDSEAVEFLVELSEAVLQ